MTPVFSRGSARRYVLDANALIGFFEGRSGVVEKVRHLLGEAARQDLPLLMSAVNWGEVFYTEWRARGEAKAREAEASLLEMPIAIIVIDRESASRAAAGLSGGNSGEGAKLSFRYSGRASDLCRHAHSCCIFYSALWI